MKLKDILARELKVWPGDVGAITQSEDGELRDYYHCKIRGWDECLVNSVADDCGPVHEGNKGAAVTRAEWQAAVDALNATKIKPATTFGDLIAFGYFPPPASLHHQKFVHVYSFEKQPEWSEDGLPNVGTKCVVYKGSYNLLGGQEDFIGPVVTVTARFKSARGVEMACVDSGTALGCHIFRADMCFHLPTAEEIAAEEKRQAIRAMVEEVVENPRSRDFAYCEALYDAGYRKQVTK